MNLSSLLFRTLPERWALSLVHWRRTSRWPDLRAPRRFNEKILHRRLHDRDPRLPGLIDKGLVKAVVAETLGPDWVTPSLFEGPGLPPVAERTWPAPFVVKSTYGSGQALFVTGEGPPDQAPDWSAIEAETRRWLHAAPALWPYDRWPYTAMRKWLLVEPFIGADGAAPADYKFYVFGGRVHVVQVDLDRYGAHRRGFYDRDWVRQDFGKGKAFAGEADPPRTLGAMIAAAETLGRGFPFARVDLYEIAGRPRFGEITFFPGSGMSAFEPDAADIRLGRLWPA
jgi:hypothetical protein